MRYFSLPFFKKHNDSLIRNKIFLLFNLLIFVIFFLFFLMDFFSPDQAENYHRASRIFFPPELTKSLILYQCIAYLFVMPFMAVFSCRVRDIWKDGISAVFAKHKPIQVVWQKIFAVVLPQILMLGVFSIISFISMKINHDTTFLTIFLAQVILFCLIVMYTSVCFALIVLFKSFEISVMFAVALVLLTISGVYIIGPWANSMANPQNLINSVLAINPLIIISTILKYDVMRSWFLYHTAQVVMFRFDYPEFMGVLLSCCAITFFTVLVTAFYFKRSVRNKLFKTSYQKFSGNFLENKINIQDFVGETVLLYSKDKENISLFCHWLLKNKFSLEQNSLNAVLNKVGYCSSCYDIFDDNDKVYAVLSFIVNLYAVKPNQKKKLIDSVSSDLGLDSCLNMKVKDCSFSQRLLLQIACSVLHNPDVIIWDMILERLNYSDRAYAVRLSGKLAKNGKYVIISTGITDFLIKENFASRIILLSSDKIALNLTSQDITEEKIKEALSL